MKDNVNHPSHYTGGSIECIDAIKEAVKDLIGIEATDTGNAIKYLWRWKRKNGVEDLKKAMWYIQHLIDEINTDSLETVEIIRELNQKRMELNSKIEKYTEKHNRETLEKDLQRTSMN